MTLHRSSNRLALASAALVAAAIFVVAPLGTPLAAQTVRKGLPGGEPQRDSQPGRRAGNGTIDGLISDTALTPIQAAEVKLLSTNVKVGTGPNGRFRISMVPAGTYVLVVRRAGYAPYSQVVDVVAADTLRISYSLERAATSLGAAVVTEQRMSSRLRDFEMRRKLGQGEFMTEADIRKRNSVYTTEIIRRFTTVNVGPSYTSGSGGAPEWLALSRREGANPMTGACPFAVFVDGVTMPTPFNLDYLPGPRWLAGIEVYNGASTIPAQYSGMNKGCGVILVWTKDGY